VRPDRPWEAGDVLRLPDLARTLAAIRDSGPDGFYRGDFAGEADRAGVFTRADLAGYRPAWRAPARFGFNGDEVVTMPLPSSGGVVLPQVLGVLERIGLEGPPGSVARLHLFAEAERRAFADRNELLGDPAGVPAEELARITSDTYLSRRAESISRDRATPSPDVLPGETGGPRESSETTNLVVVDREGGAVALTFTLNATFGSGIVLPGTGVLLNNEMDDFAAKPGRPNQFGLSQGERNRIVPGNRPLSSMAPTLVLRDGRVLLALGSPGGPRILSAVSRVLLLHIGDGLPLEAAVIAPRVHHQHLPDRIYVEDAEVVWPGDPARPGLEIDGEKADALERMGHAIEWRGAIGRVTAVSVDPETGAVTGVADPRGYGAAVAE